MNGVEFYQVLRNNYIQNGQTIYGNFTFCDWLCEQRDGTYSFRFNIPNNNPKSISRNIIIATWEANQEITDDWIEERFNMKFHDDCRLHVLNFLLNYYNHLR